MNDYIYLRFAEQESMANIGVHVYVSGYVQGVGFRYTAIRQARNLGITGWVKNLHDGRVELLLEGEEFSVRQMVEWCRHGPRGAHVTDLQTTPCSYSAKHTSFEVRF